jgi:hypothetical protein
VEVGEHTDYGLAHDPAQDAHGGSRPAGWVRRRPARRLVVNLATPEITPSLGLHIGSELSVTTGTWSGEPSSYGYQWLRANGPIPGATAQNRAHDTDRWDGASVHEWSGTYGDYLFAKVAKVFPALVDDVIA